MIYLHDYDIDPKGIKCKCIRLPRGNREELKKIIDEVKMTDEEVIVSSSNLYLHRELCKYKEYKMSLKA